MRIEITECDRQLVYRALVEKFGFKENIPLATVAPALKDAGVSPSDWGYAKLKVFLEEFEVSHQQGFLTFTDIVQGNIPQRLATVHRREEWDNIADGAFDQTQLAESTGRSAAESGHTASSEMPAASSETTTRCTTGPIPAEADAQAKSPAASFGAQANRSEAPTAAKPLSPSKEIERFAWLGPWNDFLDQLADIALEELWDFDGANPEGTHRHTILKSYICTTFYRLKTEGKILIANDGSFAAFNTGLVDKHYDDIFACFRPSNHGIPWTFAGFTAAGSRELGKRLVSLFNPLPEAASYFDRKEDMLFDTEKDLIVDYSHVIVDNMARLPMDFLKEELRGNREADDIIARIEEAVDQLEAKQLFAELGGLVEREPKYFRRLRNSIEDAVDTARRRARWNYKTAIPSYYPRGNTMSLLLPLDVTEDNLADAALVVQLMPSGAYQGQTILTMRQAYTNARLICRPDSDWLTTSQALKADDEDGEGED